MVILEVMIEAPYEFHLSFLDSIFSHPFPIPSQMTFSSPTYLLISLTRYKLSEGMQHRRRTLTIMYLMLSYLNKLNKYIMAMLKFM
jgi:hypothetical protein